MRPRTEKMSTALLGASYIAFALFAPFSISGANISIAFGFLGVLSCLLAAPGTRERFAAARKDPLVGACALLVLSALPSVLLSENRQRALRDWESYWILLVYFYVAYGLWSHRIRRATYWVLFASTTVSSLVGMVQYAGGIDILLLHIRAQPQASSTLYIMTFAGMVAMLVTVNFAVIFHRGRVGRLESFAGGALVLQLIGLLLTHTRGAWVAVAAGLGMATALLRKRSCIVVAAVLLAVVAVFAATNQRVRGKIVSIPRSLQEAPDVNVATRFVLWDVSWEMIKSHPMLGVGMGDFSTEAEKLAGERHTETVADAHNVYLHVLATRGLVGFLPFVIFWVVMLRTLWRARRSAFSAGTPAPMNFAGHFTTGVFSAAVVLLVGALSENNIDDSEIFTAFMLLAGMAKSFSLYPDASHTGHGTR